MTWCILAVVIGIARATGVVDGLITIGLSAAYLGVMFLVIRPMLKRLQAVHDREGQLSKVLVAIILVLVLASSWVTEWIGIHALFGAFVMGAIMPKGTAFVRNLSEKLEDLTIVFLLPIFFAYTGLKTQINLLDSPSLWLDTLLVIAVAVAGKWGGSLFAARAAGLGWRESSAIGVLMNTRGLMELVILSIGRDLGVISDAVFAMMVVMALVTTAMTSPLLGWIYPDTLAHSAPRGRGGGWRLLVPVSDPASAPMLAGISVRLARRAGDGARVFGLFLSRPTEREAYQPSEQARRPSSLVALVDAAAKQKLAVEPIAFPTTDTAADIARTASAYRADLVLIGYHKPLLGRSLLGGTVHRVLTTTPADVAVFINRGLPEDDRPLKILLALDATEHDALLIQLAGRLASEGSTVTVASADPDVTPPATFGAPGSVVTHRLDPRDPVDQLLALSPGHDVVIVGVSEEWGLESNLFGLRPQRLASECPVSLLIARRYRAPVGESTTTVPPVEPSPA